MAGTIAVLCVAGLLAGGDGQKPTYRTESLNGKVIDLATALREAGVSADAQAAEKQFVLRRNDHTIQPLLCDDASRAFFLDKRLRDRNVEIQARVYSGLPYVQVLTFKIEHEGKLRTPEYYCETCTISVRFPQACPCCQGPMELRMKPEEEP